jgi:hypothetical protein
MTILDDRMPAWDARRVERRVIAAPLAVVLHAANTADFLDAVRQSPLVRALFALRSTAERLASALRRRPFAEPPPPPSLRPVDLPDHGEWVRLGQGPSEIAFGVIGRFWGGETRWTEIEGAEFGRFSRPGFAKIGCHLHLTALSERHTLLVYEARTLATDPASRRAFLRYWPVVSPFVGIVMRSTLRVIERNAVSEAAGATTLPTEVPTTPRVPGRPPVLR